MCIALVCIGQSEAKALQSAPLWYRINKVQSKEGSLDFLLHYYDDPDGQELSHLLLATVGPPHSKKAIIGFPE